MKCQIQFSGKNKYYQFVICFFFFSESEGKRNNVIIDRLLNKRENYHLPLLPITHINEPVYPRGYLTRRGKYLPLGVNIPQEVTLMHVKGA